MSTLSCEVKCITEALFIFQLLSDLGMVRSLMAVVDENEACNYMTQTLKTKWSKQEDIKYDLV